MLEALETKAAMDLTYRTVPYQIGSFAGIEAAESCGEYGCQQGATDVL